MRVTKTTALFSLGVAGLLLVGCSSTPSAEPGGAEEPTVSEDSQAPLFSELPQAIQDSGVIIFGGDTHPPYRTIADDGTVSGIDPDFQAELEKQLGVTIKTEVTSGMDSLLGGMLSGRYDAFNGPVRTTVDREAEFDSIVWMTTRSSYVFLQENSDRIANSESLCGLNLAGVTGSVTESQVEKLNVWCAAEGKDESVFTGLADTNATILAVQSGRVDALATTETAALDIVDKTPNTFKYVTQSDAQGAGVDLMAMLTPKGNGLGSVFFKAVQNMFEDGSYTALMKKWNIDSVSIKEPLFNPATS